MSALIEPEVIAVLEKGLPKPHIVRRKHRRMSGFEHFFDLVSQTLANLRRNKLRSFLTLFGIAWGIASLVLMSSLSDGFRQGQRKNMKQIGDNIVFVFGGVTEEQAGGQRAGRRIRLKQSDLDLIRATCPDVEVAAAEHKNFNVAGAKRDQLGTIPDCRCESGVPEAAHSARGKGQAHQRKRREGRPPRGRARSQRPQAIV